MDLYVGQTVHYVSYGTPKGEYKSVCRAAMVTIVHFTNGAPEYPQAVGLAVLNPEGMFFKERLEYHDGTDKTETSCTAAEFHGNPFRYCELCNWREEAFKAGTWHFITEGCK